jgi:hypothetical protein
MLLSVLGCLNLLLHFPLRAAEDGVFGVAEGTPLVLSDSENERSSAKREKDQRVLFVVISTLAHSGLRNASKSTWLATLSRLAPRSKAIFYDESSSSGPRCKISKGECFDDPATSKPYCCVSNLR